MASECLMVEGDFSAVDRLAIYLELLWVESVDLCEWRFLRRDLDS